MLHFSVFKFPLLIGLQGRFRDFAFNDDTLGTQPHHIRGEAATTILNPEPRSLKAGMHGQGLGVPSDWRLETRRHQSPLSSRAQPRDLCCTAISITPAPARKNVFVLRFSVFKLSPLIGLQGRSLDFARDDDGAKRHQNSAIVPYFSAPRHHLSPRQILYPMLECHPYIEKRMEEK